MRRWNGWGDDAIESVLAPTAAEFLSHQIGVGSTVADASLAAVCAGVAASRLAPHPLYDCDVELRVRHSVGQSLPDWLKLRYGRIDAVPDAVAFPESSAEVANLLAHASAHGIALIPYGGGTSVVGHLTVPLTARAVISVDMRRMSQLLNLDTQAQLATFGAGVFGPDLEAQLRAHAYTLGHFPQSFEYSTLGGWVVTRSSGQQSLRYGRIEQLFAGGRVETPRGTLSLPSFPASAAALDLRELVLGSEGRIGILTEVTVRVRAQPATEEFHAFFFPQWDAAQSAVMEIVRAVPGLSMLRLSNAAETATSLQLAGASRLLALLQRYLAWRGCGEQRCLLLVGASGDAAAVRTALAPARRLARAHGGIAVGRAIGEKWRHGRFKNVYLRNSLWQQGYAIDTVETACNWPQVKNMMTALESAAQQAFAQDGERVHGYTHLSHMYAQGASVYSTFVFRLSGDYERDLARWQRLKAATAMAIVAHGGTISHQHGVGQDHAPYLQAEKGALGLATMAAVYRHFDPEGMMNPHKTLPERLT
ncbi:MULTISPECIES: FAD-binding oxidoreductase [unclassified Undibacterium]|uniref:FAD-binding oxidoreductase n=1 Tax=unclassified Undibacterium TaxID=2630295 RepID=UPI002AC9BD14|nr:MULTISPECIES: FAD-binding oxidoreductase [unclassified Undibacterium]MEB0139297.1 FAD-binding oxidoreductase [Undibacterium sp. CCC2.1]MEB0172141.1 FAD-binding oxidoreductase [Undibacterium sp. CCC1.1]MEB0176068.1 FAD-binding oxidoreductase [Undibacterium sp. CCC3.4]MEB0215380.1 FAD-binding oxidoreductase [Undibacterium sp. 5I2]WPX43453.1 FAD-binding oxidoreductase [Undibacterium sp. CCC3.4]